MEGVYTLTHTHTHTLTRTHNLHGIHSALPIPHTHTLLSLFLSPLPPVSYLFERIKRERERERDIGSEREIERDEYSIKLIVL